jgi:hypothetical protein
MTTFSLSQRELPVFTQERLDEVTAMLRQIQVTNECLRGYLPCAELDQLQAGVETAIIAAIDDFLAE